MIDPKSLAQFLSGRALGLLCSLAFQVAVVRLLTPRAYGLYAIVMAVSALAQTLASFGLPRVTARFLSRSGEGLARGAARRLAMTVLTFKLGLGLAILTLALGAAALIDPAAASLILAGGAYSLGAALQSDADGVAQALGLQSASRAAAAGEPFARLAGLLAFAARGCGLTLFAVLWIGATTAAVAALMLTVAFWRRLSAGEDAPGAAQRLDWTDIRRTALGGYGGAVSWLVFSPPVIRLLASRVLPAEAFAGFSFVQALVVSLQRYAPSFVLFPLAEPAAMADLARTGRPERLRAALSLLVKLDAVAVGAVIVGVAAAGAPLILVLTHGRYGQAAGYLPWLLLLIVANASHRSYEIAAIAMGAPGALIRALGLTLGWLAAALIAAPYLGVWPMLLCPLGDAATRLWLVQRALDRRGDGDGVTDVRALSLIGTAAVVVSLIGGVLVGLTPGGLILSLGVGSAAAVTFLGVVAILRPIRPDEAAILAAAAPWTRGRRGRRRSSTGPVRVMVLTPRGAGGTGGVDRLMDSLRPLLAAHADVEVRFVTTRGSGRWPNPLVGGLALIRIGWACLARRVEVIHVNLGAHGGCYRKMALLAAPRLLGTPYVLHLHGSAFGSFWLAAPPIVRRQIDALFREAAGVIVLGEAWRALVTGRVPEAAPRTVVMPNATPLRPEGLAGQAGPVQILFLGELGPRKGTPVLLRALAALKSRQPWRAVLAGDGDRLQAARLTAELRLGSRVTLPGWVGSADVDRLLAAADILVLPSFEENLPMAVVEAFAAGVAVVTTPVGALPDILKHDRTGLFVSPGDVDALTLALRRLIEDPALRRRLGRAGKRHHAEHLAIGPYADRVVRLWAATASHGKTS